MRQIVGLLVFAAVASNLCAQEATRTIAASDKRTYVEVPEHWSVLDLNDAADIEVGSDEDEAYLMVINELKDDLYGWNLQKHSHVALGRLMANVVFPKLTGPKSLTIGGRPAVQYEVRGGSENGDITYVHTTVDGEKYFSQIVAWTAPSREAVIRPQLLRAISSFREAE